MRVVDSAETKPGSCSDRISALLAGIDNGYLSHVVNTLSYPRHYVAQHEDNRRAGAWVAEQFRGLGYHVVSQGRYENVVAAHPGCGAAPGVLVASHYDRENTCESRFRGRDVS